MSQTVRIALGTCFAAIFGYCLWVQGLLLFENAPLEYRENAIVFATEFMAGGGNFYDWAELPLRLNVYGPAYHALMATLVRLSPIHDLLLHRTVSAILILASVTLVVLWLRSRKISIFVACAGGLLLYVQFLRISLPSARPDPLGLFLLLLSLFVLDVVGIGWGTMLFVLACGVVAGLSKPYFAICVVSMLAYAFLNQGWRRASLYSGVSILAGGLLAWGIADVYPAYFYSVVQVNAGYGLGWHWAHLGKQVVKFAYVNSPLLAGLAWLAIRAYRVRESHPEPLRMVLGPRYLRDVPLLQSVLAVAVLFKLAQNTGSEEYFYHLLTPFFVIFALERLHARLSLTTVLGIILVQCVLYLPRIPENSTAAWESVRRSMLDSGPTLAVAPAAHVARAMGNALHDSGQTEYFVQGLRIESPQTRIAATRWDAYSMTLQVAIDRQQFNQVVIAQGMPFINGQIDLHRCYAQEKALLDAPMHYTRGIRLEIWKRKASGCAPEQR